MADEEEIGAQESLEQRITQLTESRALPMEELLPILYDDLRGIADDLFRREHAEFTLQPTALVHEAYLKLVDQRNQHWENRAHFLGVAATAMRRVLTNAAKSRGRQKRGGDRDRVTLGEGDDAVDPSALQIGLLDLDDALTALASVKERYVRIVELRYFAGLSLDEVAELLGIGRTVVVRESGEAKSWLAQYLRDHE